MEKEVVVALIGSTTALAGIFLSSYLQRRDKRKHEARLDEMAFVLAHLLSLHELAFLVELGKPSGLRFEDGFRQKDHLRRLRDLGFVERTAALDKIEQLRKGDLVAEKLKILPAGSTYLKLRDQSQRQQALLG
jgi:hypothetical protein